MRIHATVILFLFAATTLAEEPSVLPKQYLRDQDFFAGHWHGTGNIGNDTATIDFNARWMPGKHCLLINGTIRKKGQEPVKWSLLSGCDTTTGEMVDCAFASDGDSNVTRWKSLSESEQVGTETGIANGKPYTIQCKAIKHGPDAWTYTGATPTGDPVAIEYKRVKEEKRQSGKR